MSLGELLLGRGILSEAELSSASRVAKERGVSLEEALIALGLLTEDQLGALAAEEHGLPFVFPYASAIDRGLFARFPRELLLRRRALPVMAEGDRVVVALAAPPPEPVRRELEAACGLPVSPVLASARRIERVLAEVAGETAAPRGPAGAADPAAVALLYGSLARALDSGADEIRFEPREGALSVRFRRAGRLEEDAREPAAAALALAARARALIGDPQALRGAVRTSIGGRDVVLEVAILPGREGESVLIRIARGGAPSGAAPAAAGSEQLAALGRLGRGLALIASPDGRRGRALAYEAARAAGPEARSVVAIEREPLEPEPLFRQVAPEALEAALAYAPDVLLLGEPPEDRAAIAAVLRAAAARLVLAASDDPDAVEAAIGWLERGARPSALARVLARLVSAGPEGIDVREPPAALREAIDRGAAPREIRAASGGL
jgi:hypothetical protein